MNNLCINSMIIAVLSGCSIQAGMATTEFDQPGQKLPTSSSEESGTTPDVLLWQTALQKSPPQSSGCWHAEYPNKAWIAKDCDKKATSETYSTHGYPRLFTTGYGTDFVAKTALHTRKSTGFFSSVKGVKSITINTASKEKSYSLQMNTNFSDSKNGYVALGNTTPFCHHNKLSECATWQQFLYVSEGERIYEKHPSFFRHAAYIENWVYIPLKENCPAGWHTRITEDTDTLKSCFKDSGWAGTPVISAAENLDKIRLTGIASLAGQDVVMLFNDKNAYASSQSGKTTEVASTWSETEFNIAGPFFPYSTAIFNAGSSLNVHLAVDDDTDNPYMYSWWNDI